MDDYILVDLHAKLPLEESITFLRTTFPEFTWRLGDSEYEGRHMRGTTEERVVIEIWFEDKPVGGSISFSLAWKDLPNKEEKKSVMYKSIRQRLSPAYEILKADGAENESSVT